MQPARQSRLLLLPFELRSQIWGYLLPDIPVINIDAEPYIYRFKSRYDPNYNGWNTPGVLPKRNWTNLRENHDPCETQILRVNRQLHEECTEHLYAKRQYTLGVWSHNLNGQRLDGPIDNRPYHPHHRIENLVITVPSTAMFAGGSMLRESFVWMCGLLAHHQAHFDKPYFEKVHFKKLRIEFSDCCDDWKDAWDAAYISDWNGSRPAFLSDRWLSAQPDRHYTPPHPDVGVPFVNDEEEAYYSGFTSTFAWLLSPLAMLNNIADECVIDLPKSIKHQEHMIAEAQWYEEGLTGKYAFTVENSAMLRIDRDAFKTRWDHRDGHMKDCPCFDCQMRFCDYVSDADDEAGTDTSSDCDLEEM
ncbi:MAG: hypothetical protein Q9220_005246 [cf. Caloplaca sp. 1 TL-2023]